MQTDAFTNRRCCTQSQTPFIQRVLHTGTFTPGRFCTKHFYTQTPFHTHTFSLTLLHTDVFAHRRFCTQTTLPRKPPFYCSACSFDARPSSCERVARDNRIFSVVSGIRPSFRAKGLRATAENRTLTAFLATDLHFVQNTCELQLKGRNFVAFFCSAISCERAARDNRTSQFYCGF